MVEDHPFEYGTFEGIIPDSHYGAGPVLIWDSGNYEPIDTDIIKGLLEFTLYGKKLKGIFVLTRLKQKENEWLLIKKKDSFAQSTYETISELTQDKLKTLKEKSPAC